MISAVLSSRGSLRCGYCHQYRFPYNTLRRFAMIACTPCTVLDSSCIQWHSDIASKTWDMHVEQWQGTNCASCHRLWRTLARRKCDSNWLNEGKIMKESMAKAWFQTLDSSMNLANKPTMHVCVRHLLSWIAVCRAVHSTGSFKPSETETYTLAEFLSRFATRPCSALRIASGSHSTLWTLICLRWCTDVWFSVWASFDSW